MRSYQFSVQMFAKLKNESLRASALAESLAQSQFFIHQSFQLRRFLKSFSFISRRRIFGVHSKEAKRLNAAIKCFCLHSGVVYCRVLMEIIRKLQTSLKFADRFLKRQLRATTDSDHKLFVQLPVKQTLILRLKLNEWSFAASCHNTLSLSRLASCGSFPRRFMNLRSNHNKSLKTSTQNASSAVMKSSFQVVCISNLVFGAR